MSRLNNSCMANVGPRKDAAASTAAPRRTRGRPPSIDQEKLLGIARDLFLEKGIRATTQEVADRAGVSEGAIFHRFKTKEALFKEAMGFDIGSIPRRMTEAILQAEEFEIREALIHVAMTMLDIGREAVPMMMMSWSNPDCNGQFPAEAHRTAFETMLKRFAQYFEVQMAEGKMRKMDGEIVTRVFMGALHHYHMVKMMLGPANDRLLPEGMFVRGLVDLILGGGAPVPPADASTRRLSRL